MCVRAGMYDRCDMQRYTPCTTCEINTPRYIHVRINISILYLTYTNLCCLFRCIYKQHSTHTRTMPANRQTTKKTSSNNTRRTPTSTHTRNGKKQKVSKGGGDMFLYTANVDQKLPEKQVKPEAHRNTVIKQSTRQVSAEDKEPNNNVQQSDEVPTVSVNTKRKMLKILTTGAFDAKSNDKLVRAVDNMSDDQVERLVHLNVNKMMMLLNGATISQTKK